MKNGKHRGQKKQKRKRTYDKSGGITHDTAAFAFRTKDILKIRSRPRLEPGSDYHYLVRVTGLEPARRGHQNLNLARLPIPPYPQVRLVYPFCGYLSILMICSSGVGRLRSEGICADAARAHKRVDTCGFHPLENHPFPLDSLAQITDM